MQRTDAVIRLMLRDIGAAVLSARTARGWSQRRLGTEAGISQTMISAIERAALPDLPLPTAISVLLAADIEFELRLVPPQRARPIVRDRAHARCVAYVARRLARAGFRVATEVEIGQGRWRGFIDVLAYHPLHRLLLVIEVKTEIVDVGGIDRQLGSYERAAWQAARGLGWRPRAPTGVLLPPGHRRERSAAPGAERLLRSMFQCARPPAQRAGHRAGIDPPSS
jgi:transcriptional regulator with XRE-family HTH domain